MPGQYNFPTVASDSVDVYFGQPEAEIPETTTAR